MSRFFKTLTTFIPIFTIVLLTSSFKSYNSKYINIPEGYYIDWQSNTKLQYSDFKASKKWNKGSTVASSYCGFGYSITYNNGEISGSIFVRFNGEKSWFNPDIEEFSKVNYILKHEQLHFDICELFGRKLHKEVLLLIDLNKLNKHNISRVQSKLEKEYSDYQKKYDKETNHSINVEKQLMWNSKIKHELASLSNYSNYNSF
jgi:hypothetical protein